MSQTHPLEAAFFDLFHTLVDMRHVPENTSTADVLGIDAKVWARFVMEKSPHHALGTVEDPIESIRIIAHAIDPSIPEEKIRAAAEVRPIRFRTALIEVQPEILDALRRMHAGGLKLGLISNAGLDEIGAWDDSPLAPFFATALFSCREGVMKPDAAIYLRACERLGVRPEHCVFIGDGGSQEHDGARAVGMRTILFLEMLEYGYPELAKRRPETIRTDWVARRTPDLTALVCRLCDEGLP